MDSMNSIVGGAWDPVVGSSGVVLPPELTPCLLPPLSAELLTSRACAPAHQPPTPLQSCTWEFDADRRRVVTLLGPGLVQRGTGGGGGGRPKTLREAIRGQQRAAG